MWINLSPDREKLRAVAKKVTKILGFLKAGLVFTSWETISSRKTVPLHGIARSLATQLFMYRPDVVFCTPLRPHHESLSPCIT